VVFIEWQSVVRVFVIVLMLTAGACGIWLVRMKRWPIRLPIRLLSSLLVLVGILGALFFWGFPNPNSYSVPVYSPNGKIAARVYEYNASGFGGADSSVELFAARGLKSRVVFFGEYGSVEIANVRWKSDSELEVSYHGRAYTCTGAFNVKVRCTAW
jgi:hypothetical protein